MIQRRSSMIGRSSGASFQASPTSFLEVMAVENAAHDVLGTRLRAPLEKGDLEPRLGHGDRRCRAGRSGADNHRIELFIVGH